MKKNLILNNLNASPNPKDTKNIVKQTRFLSSPRCFQIPIFAATAWYTFTFQMTNQQMTLHLHSLLSEKKKFKIKHIISNCSILISGIRKIVKFTTAIVGSPDLGGTWRLTELLPFNRKSGPLFVPIPKKPEAHPLLMWSQVLVNDNGFESSDALSSQIG